MSKFRTRKKQRMVASTSTSADKFASSWMTSSSTRKCRHHVTVSSRASGGNCTSPEREFLEHPIVFSQKNVSGKVDMMAYQCSAYTLGQSSGTSNLYSETEASMDSLEGFSPKTKSGFIVIKAIRIKKYSAGKVKEGKPLAQSS
ncbi:hypothetical protein F5B21DRAFT_497032 [Xylaria acuta]|nr:hypothetical protein F5B21DRAFT_497032 [Xylaria acuta]